MLFWWVFCSWAFCRFLPILGKFWSSAEINVPDVVGKSSVVAQQILEDKNLRVKIVEANDDSVPAGQVVSQYPEAGAKVKEQRLVTITVSKGGQELTMPDLKSMSRSNAEEKLKKMGLKLGAVLRKMPRNLQVQLLIRTQEAVPRLPKDRQWILL